VKDIEKMSSSAISQKKERQGVSSSDQSGLVIPDFSTGTKLIMSPVNGVSQFEDMKSTEPMIRVLKAEKGTSKELKFVNLLTPQLKE